MNFDFINYFKNIAISLKDIAHTTIRPGFVRVSSITEIEEFLQNSYNISETVMMVQDNYTGRFNNNSGTSNLLDDRFFTFFIVKKVNQKDFDDRQNKIKCCIDITKKIFSKMLKDKKEDYNNNNLIGLADFDINSPNYDTIGPIGDNFWGILVNFSIKEPLENQLIYNSDDWK